MLIFSVQNVIKDPPFSKLDLISCRNLLIYLNNDLQKKLIPLFHYALNPQGTLYLGTSENLSGFDYLFSAIDNKSKLFQRKDDIFNTGRTSLEKFIPPLTPMDATYQRLPSAKKNKYEMLPLRELTEQTLLQQMVPACALVNEQGDILYIHGRTGRYMEPAPGKAGINNIFKMAREGLQHALTISMHKVRLGNEIVYNKGLRVKTNGDFSIVDMTICPVSENLESSSETALYLVILNEATALEAKQIKESIQALALSEDTDTDACIVALKKELHEQDEYLQSINEELETTNEELKSTNEEMQSVNEELQSTNEELETSKEELQSVNEELNTVNAEMQSKLNDLTRTNNDMNNLLAGTGIGTIFVDHQLRILRFTPTVTDIVNLIPVDTGRPIGHIVSNLPGYDTLTEDIRSVLDTLIPKELDVQTISGKWYTMTISPYRTIENVIEGAVITFFDITATNKVQEELRQANEQLRMAVVVRDANDAITAQDLDGKIIAWNPAATKAYGWSEKEALKMNICDIVPPGEEKEETSKTLQLCQNKILIPYDTKRVAKDGSIIKIKMTSTALLNEAGKIYAIATTERMI